MSQSPTTSLVPAGPAGTLVPAASPAARLLAAFLEGRSPRTLRAYAGDLETFATWSQAETTEQACSLLLAAGPGGANEAVLRYRNHLTRLGLAPATVNRRLAALRSLVKLAKLLGQVGFELYVPSLRSESYRETRGPGKEGVRALLTKVGDRTDAKGARDRALLRLMYDLGLRRGEAVSLNLADVDLTANCLWVLGKGKRERSRMTLPRQTAEAVQAWIVHRGEVAGPLFMSLAPPHRGQMVRLSGTSVYRMVRGLGEQVGIRARPHGLRHAGATRLLEITGGNIREVQKWTRHAKVDTVLRYDDNRTDAGGSLASRLADDSAG